MKIRLIAIAIASLTLWTYAGVLDVYSLTVNLKVPRVYKNTDSQGYRRLQAQHLSGELVVKYSDEEVFPQIYITNLVNHSHKINHKNITYTCYQDESSVSRLNYLGNNRSNLFTKPGLSMSFVADPSYNIGDVEEDNSLYLNFAGYGVSSTSKIRTCRIPIKLSGNATGNLGCGCSAYGHKSPTRVVGYCGPTDFVDDVAPVFGKWKAKFKLRKYQ